MDDSARTARGTFRESRNKRDRRTAGPSHVSCHRHEFRPLVGDRFRELFSATWPRVVPSLGPQHAGNISDHRSEHNPRHAPAIGRQQIGPLVREQHPPLRADETWVSRR